MQDNILRTYSDSSRKESTRKRKTTSEVKDSPAFHQEKKNYRFNKKDNNKSNPFD